MDLCPARIFGVTGSDGKTTTTTVIYEILKQQGYKCWLGGNIGTPLLDRIEEIGEDDMVVLELSSFQLMTAKHSPDVAVITNISPNHLDIHKSMDEYVDAKKNIFRHQGKNNLLVLNKDNNESRNFPMRRRHGYCFSARRRKWKKARSYLGIALRGKTQRYLETGRYR